MQLSLVAYEAPAPYYASSNVSQQVITSVATGTYGPGTYSQTVTLPNSYFQVNFACGAELPQLEANGSRVDYQYENRLDSYDNGGTQASHLQPLGHRLRTTPTATATSAPATTGLGGVTVTLSGTTYVGATLVGTNLTPIAVSYTTTTAGNGTYSFAGLAPGKYTVTEATPSGYATEAANVGTSAGPPPSARPPRSR